MGFLPTTVCRRCHREYSAFKGRCPYCGTKKPREVKHSLPETDSAVRGTQAARQAAENVNWQMVIGGALLLLILIVVIAIVSVNVSNRVSEIELQEEALQEEIPEIEAETTAVPIPTATPSPTPEPTPSITSISITWLGQPLPNGFMDYSGSTYDLDATPYPLMEDVEVEWYSTDESCATVDQNGVVTIVGSWGDSCYIVAKVGTFEERVQCWAK